MADQKLTSNDEADENIERQRNELELLQTMYPDELCISHRPGSEAGCELEFRVDGRRATAQSHPSKVPWSCQVSCYVPSILTCSPKRRRHFLFHYRSLIHRTVKQTRSSLSVPPQPTTMLRGVGCDQYYRRPSGDKSPALSAWISS